MTRTLLPPTARRVFCNRTLNMRSIKAVGCDMDYTLIHYHTDVWERRAYEYTLDGLAAQGLPVKGMEFDPEFATRGLVMDRELGNLVKPDRFGFIRKASHGTRMLSFEEQHRVYAGVTVDLALPRWQFMNTLFSLSEANLFAQLVDKMDAGKLPHVFGYSEVLRLVRTHLDATHMEGKLKSEIVANPAKFVDLDRHLPLTLLDLKHAGKLLLLITNSAWSYTKEMMRYAFDDLLPGKMTWRDLFDVTIVSARKPSFFGSGAPAFEVVDDTGLLRPLQGKIQRGGLYLGGNAATLEKHLDLAGEQVLYIGDHLFADVHVSKSVHRWRTALVIREIERELQQLEAFRPNQAKLNDLMEEKEQLERQAAQDKVSLLRLENDYGPKVGATSKELKGRLHQTRSRLQKLDEQIVPLAKQAVELTNERWGLLMRAGNDKSHFARQVERYADIYMSRVSNLMFATPYIYLRSPRGTLPHDTCSPA